MDRYIDINTYICMLYMDTYIHTYMCITHTHTYMHVIHAYIHRYIHIDYNTFFQRVHHAEIDGWGDGIQNLVCVCVCVCVCTPDRLNVIRRVSRGGEGHHVARLARQDVDDRLL
jgi:hypothetical protein